jgi:hypothetical protein
MPKDMLVEIICKEFERIEYGEFFELFKEKCKDELKRKKRTLHAEYFVSDVTIFYGRSGFCVETDKESILEIFVPLNLEKIFKFFHIQTETIACEDEQDVLNRINEILSEKFNTEIAKRCIDILQNLFQCYRERKEIKRILKYL